MVAEVINIADYRKRKTETEQCGPAVSVATWPMLLPVFCGFGCFVVPVTVPMFVDGGTRA
ncbi:MAG: hypothetical protein ABSC06_22105 [Rhodopila sp.]|jgi:hypothetical protein